MNKDWNKEIENCGQQGSKPYDLMHEMNDEIITLREKLAKHENRFNPNKCMECGDSVQERVWHECRDKSDS